MTQKTDRRPYRPDIDGLRAVAISSVVAFHACPQGLPGGFLGVDVFFVISGFLIAGIVLHEQAAGTFTISTFYQRRVRRIFPALIVVLLTGLGVGMVGLFDVELLQLARHAFFGAFGLANLSLYNDTAYFSLAAATNPLLHLWSLGVEEQFYLVLPPLVLILGGRTRSLLMAFLAIFTGSLLLNLNPFSNANVTSTFYLPQYRAWELMAGVLLAYTTQRIVDKRASLFRMVSPNAASATGMSLLCFAFLYFNRTSPQWVANGTVVVGSVLLLVAGIEAGVNRCVLSCSPVVFAGMISYPLYLWHWPLLVFGRLAEPRLGVLTSFGLTGISVMLAFLTWRFVEKPIRTSERVFSSSACLAFAMACVGGLACSLFLQDGRVGWAKKTSPLDFQSREIRQVSWTEKISSLLFQSSEDSDQQCVERYWGQGCA